MSFRTTLDVALVAGRLRLSIVFVFVFFVVPLIALRAVFVFILPGRVTGTAWIRAFSCHNRLGIVMLDCRIEAERLAARHALLVLRRMIKSASRALHAMFEAEPRS
jgi:hypothetical protein